MTPARRFPGGALLQDAAVALTSQVVVSAANFFVGIILIRAATSTEYGLFVLANAALLLAAGLQNALIGAPMAVFVPKLGRERQAHFAGAVALTQLAVWLPLLAAAALFVVIGREVGLIDAGSEAIAWLTVPVALLVVGREFFRQSFFVFRRPAGTLVVDTVSSVLFLGGVYWIAGRSEVPALMTIAVIGGACAGAMAVGGVLYARIIGGRLSADFGPLRQFWSAAWWGVLGMLVSWAEHHGFFYVLGGLEGADAVANVAAARLLLMPIAVLLTAVVGIVRPRCAAWLGAGEGRAMVNRVLAITFIVGSLSVLYTAVVWWAQDFVLEHVFRKTVIDVHILVPLWGAAFLIQVLRQSLMLVLQALERFRTLFFAGLLGAFGALAVGYAGVLLLGPAGSVAGVAVGEGLYAIAIAAVVLRERAGGRLQ